MTLYSKMMIDLNYRKLNNMQRKTLNKETTATSGLQVPGLGQAHNVCGGVKHVCERSTLPLTWDSGKMAQQ